MSRSVTTTKSATLNGIPDPKAKDYSHLLGMEGFSDKLLKTHFELYEGYVKNTATLQQKLKEIKNPEDHADPAFSELKRRFGWEYNGVKLHELYFDNLTKEKTNKPESDFESLVQEQFGSFDKWKNEFLATAGARGIGWAILFQDPESQQLFNCWIDEHNNGHLAEANPILVLDAFEHAYVVDYGIDRKSYLATFFKHVNWVTVENRLAKNY